MRSFRNSILNLGLRGFSMLAKFVLVFYIAKNFSAEALGIFGVFATSITLAYFIVGLDFYNYSSRELLNALEKDHFTIIRNQFLFYLLTYTIFLPIIGIIFFIDLLPFLYILPFFPILIFEHLSQEFYRLYIVLCEPLFANLLLFLRSGLWVYILILIWYYNPEIGFSLKWVWWAWACGSALSVFIAAFKLFHKYRKFPLSPVKWSWYIKGVKVSVFFFGATISYKIIEFSDRYMIDILLGKESVGIYTFYNQIANLINVIIFTLIIMITYPELIRYFNSNQTKNFLNLKTQMSRKIIFYSSGLAIVLWFLIKPILDLMNKKEFFEEIHSFYVLLISNIVLNISFIAHYVLFAFKSDKAILLASCYGAILNLILNFILIPNYGILGAATATFVSYLGIWLIKLYFMKKEEAGMGMI